MSDLTVYRVEHRFNCDRLLNEIWPGRHPYHGPSGGENCDRVLMKPWARPEYGMVGPGPDADRPNYTMEPGLEICGVTAEQAPKWWSSYTNLSKILRAAVEGWRLVEYRVPEDAAHVLETQVIFEHAQAREVAVHGLLHFDPEFDGFAGWRWDDPDRGGLFSDDVEEFECECSLCVENRADDNDLFREAVAAGVSPTFLFPEDGFDEPFSDLINESLNRRAA
jgi:hypothetical protein